VRLAVDRTRSQRHIRAQRDFLPHQRLHGALGHHQKHDVQLIGAHLEHPPAFINLAALPKMSEGHLLSDLIAINASVDIVMGEVDR